MYSELLWAKSPLSDVSLLSLPSNLRRNRHCVFVVGLFFLLTIPPRLPLPKPAETSSVPNIVLANEGSLNAVREADRSETPSPGQRWSLKYCLNCSQFSSSFAMPTSSAPDSPALHRREGDGCQESNGRPKAIKQTCRF